MLYYMTNYKGFTPNCCKTTGQACQCDFIYVHEYSATVREQTFP
jgi:hypothetical protein